MMCKIFKGCYDAVFVDDTSFVDTAYRVCKGVPPVMSGSASCHSARSANGAVKELERAKEGEERGR
jgi:hypothetical protein